jgi:hypothetical protein
MAKTPPERLAAALRANIKRRKGQKPALVPPATPKAPEILKENVPVPAWPNPRGKFPLS